MLIQCIELNIYIQEKLILKNINLKLYPSKVYRIVGDNGSGKSVLLNSLLGLGGILKGDIKRKLRKEDICYISDTAFFYDDESVEFVLAMIQFLFSIKRADLLRVLKQIDFDYQFYRKKKIHMLSKGTRKKLQLIPLFQDYKHYFLDEIFDGLDADSVEVVKQRIQEVVENKSTILIIEHQNEIIQDLNLREETIICQNRTVLQK